MFGSGLSGSSNDRESKHFSCSSPSAPSPILLIILPRVRPPRAANTEMFLLAQRGGRRDYDEAPDSNRARAIFIDSRHSDTVFDFSWVFKVVPSPAGRDYQFTYKGRFKL